MFYIKYLNSEIPFTYDYWVQKRLAILRGTTTLQDFGTVFPKDISEYEYIVWLGLQRAASLLRKPLGIPYYEDSIDETGTTFTAIKSRLMVQEDVEHLISAVEMQINLILYQCMPLPEDMKVAVGDTVEKKS